MYETLLQSSDRPFRATPDTRFYFPSDSVEQARQTVLRTMLRAEGPAMVLGGAGCGKSMLCQKLAEDLDSRFDIVKLDSSGLCSRRALLQSILFDLRLPYRDLNEGELRMSIMDRLIPSPETAPDGVVFIVDEAQTLPGKLLEELRLITNFARQGQPRARLVLVGNMRLEDTFAHPQMDSFNQRLAARCYLQPMTCEQTMEFVRHQLRCVGISPSNIVTGEALRTVYAASEGIPRLVNQVMDHALVLGIASGQCPISAALIEEAWSDLQQLPAPWHTASLAGNTDNSSLIEFGELAEDTNDGFDNDHSAVIQSKHPVIQSESEVTQPMTMPANAKRDTTVDGAFETDAVQSVGPSFFAAFANSDDQNLNEHEHDAHFASSDELDVSHGEQPSVAARSTSVELSGVTQQSIPAGVPVFDARQSLASIVTVRCSQDATKCPLKSRI